MPVSVRLDEASVAALTGALKVQVPEETVSAPVVSPELNVPAPPATVIDPGAKATTEVLGVNVALPPFTASVPV